MPRSQDGRVARLPLLSLSEALEVASHELGHDVAEVSTAAEQLADVVSTRRVDEEVDEELVQLVGRLSTAVEQLSRSLGELLDDPEQLRRLQLSPVRVADVVERILEVHDPSGHHVEHDVASVVVRLDRVKFERIVDNLLLNALQHTPAGCEVRLQVAAVPGGGVEIVVEDDGPGLPAETAERIFGSGPDQGRGGLSIVARLARLHGGDARADVAASGRGLRVTVTLPTRLREGGDAGS
jgi:signal transduction histidine kinase